MIKIRVFRGWKKQSIITEMHKYNFKPFVALLVTDPKKILPGDRITLPKDVIGTIVSARRSIFRFWKWEYLVEQKAEIGYFYTWHKESKVSFLEDENK